MRKVLKMVIASIALGVIVYGFKDDTLFTVNEKIKIIKDYERLSSFADLRKYPEFKNKVLYIDIWGTSCKPCINEFKHVHNLKEQFKNEAVEYLYFASPYGRFDDTQKWKSGIKKFNLEGYNALMNEEFYLNLWKENPQMKNEYKIPHYLIIAKNGDIVDYNAPRPSSNNKLYKAISEELK